MGKGFQNYMSKKDFHPSAIWNLKKVFIARQKQSLEKKKQEELRSQYDKEQEVLNNKALLGDEKARLGLAFIYEAPAGIKKDEKEIKPGLEPKFEWQRKYNAPREDWAKGDESILDQPFGIQVRNVRCVKCHTWGHVNTDRECPLYNMSGNHEDAGLSTNPSEIIKQLKTRGKMYTVDAPSTSKGESAKKNEKIDDEELMQDMKVEYGLALKRSIVNSLREDKALENIDKKKKKHEEEADQQQMMFEFLKSLSEKERSKIFNKFFNSTKNEKSSNSDSDSGKKRKKTKKRSRKRENSEEKPRKRVKREKSDSEDEKYSKRHRRKHEREKEREKRRR